MLTILTTALTTTIHRLPSLQPQSSCLHTTTKINSKSSAKIDTIGTQYCQEDDDRPGIVVTGDPKGPSRLRCYRRWSQNSASLQCHWTAGKDLEQYRLCYCCDTCKKCMSFEVGNGSRHMVPRDDLYLNKNLTFWVEATFGHKRLKSQKLFVVPMTAIKYKAPQDKKIKLVRSRGHLTLTWKKPEVKEIHNEIQYRRQSFGSWNQTDCVSSESRPRETCKVSLESSSAYQLRIRRMLNLPGSTWSGWSETIFIPAEITQSLRLRWSFTDGPSQHCPGERHVQLRWQPPTDPGVDVLSYNLTFQPALDKPSITKVLQNTSSYYTAISLAPYSVSIVAINRVGASVTETISIPPAPPQETPNLNITIINNRTLAASWAHRKVRSYCIVLELVVESTILSNTCQSRKLREIEKNTGRHLATGMFQKVFDGLEPLKRYRVTVHANEGIVCESESGYTIGSSSVCTQEHAPTRGPSKVNVTNINKRSVQLEWEELFLDQCQGTLQEYLIFYRNTRNHSHTVTVNSSTLSLTLINLNTSTLYTLAICGVTSTGQGAKTLRNFQTKDYDQSELTAIVVATSISIMVAVFIVASLCYLSIKRSKHIICPTIPDPVNSLAVQSMHSSVNTSQWVTSSDDQDVTDVLVVMVSVQSDSNIVSPSENDENEIMSMTESVGLQTYNDSFSSENDPALEYRRQMGLEEDRCSETELNQLLGTEGSELVISDIPPLRLQPYTGSGLNLCGNMISLLAVYDQNLTEREAGTRQHHL
uniref:interleukin-12 receptor subunit beta-1-like isoform X2 n=1 Tax=Pristiophorus japonicus TaxID=55135 RepID=UPI00398F0E04